MSYTRKYVIIVRKRGIMNPPVCNIPLFNPPVSFYYDLEHNAVVSTTKTIYYLIIYF